MHILSLKNECFIAHVDSIEGDAVDFEEISAKIFTRSIEPDAVFKRAIPGSRAIGS